MAMQYQTKAPPPMTVAQFDAWVQHDTSDKRYEYVAGEVIDVVSNSYVSELAMRIGFLIMLYLHQNQIEGRVMGADGGFKIGDDRYIPDVTYVAGSRQPRPSHEAYNSTTPDLVVEVISNTGNRQELKALRQKTTNYLAHGVLVWIVDPAEQAVEVHQAGREVQVLRLSDTLTGGDVLPGLRIAVKDIFAVLDNAPDDETNEE